MAEMRNFSPEQIDEAEEWYKNNYPNLLEIVGGKDRDFLYGTYFDLKMIDKELRPNQFILGVDYKSRGSYEENIEAVINGQLTVNLSFWNPHGSKVVDKFAMEFLKAQLSKL